MTGLLQPSDVWRTTAAIKQLLSNIGLFESKHTCPTLLVGVVTMESVKSANLADRYAQRLTVLQALREISDRDPRVPSFVTGRFGVPGAELVLNFVEIPESLAGLSAFRLLSRMWPTLDGLVVLAEAADMRDFNSVFSNLFLRNLSGLPSNTLFPRLLLCHDTWVPWSVTRLLLLSQRGDSSLPMLPSSVLRRIHTHLSDRGLWSEGSQPDVKVRTLCSSMSGPWAKRAPCAVRCIPPVFSDCSNDESLRSSLDWLVTEIKAQKAQKARPFW